MHFEYHRSVGEHYLHVAEHSTECFGFPLHLHKSFEAFFVEEGEVTVQIAERKFAVKAGECALIFPGQPHAYASEKRNLSALCIFSEDYVPELSGGRHPVFPLSFDFLKELREAREDVFRVRSLLYLLASHYVKGEKDESLSVQKGDLVCSVVQYIEEHFAEAITLADMAKALGYHYRYLSTVVNRCFGAGFSEVINRYRVDLACRYLRETDESVTEIASRVGYDSQRSFNRSFKAVVGKTPREYRREKGAIA